MKNNHFKIIVFSLASLLFFSCSNDFLYEKSPLQDVTATTLASNIIVSPAWGAEDYEIFAPSPTFNADFRITDAPEWLILTSGSGKFSAGTARINCSVREMKAFSKIGIYYGVMTIEAEGGMKYFVQVAYVNEGNPRIEAPEKVTLSSNNSSQIQIFNSGEGILAWQVEQCPEWLRAEVQNHGQTQTSGQYPSGVLTQRGVALLYCNISTDKFSEVLKGQIIIASNDKTNPQKTIDIDVDLGNPRIYWGYNSTLDFGKTEISLPMQLSNQSDGILLWQFSDLPEWLTCSKSSGMMFNFNWETVTFTVNRSRVPESISAATIYLNSNDVSNPHIPITVKIFNSTTNSTNVTGIDGTLTDAWLDKSNGKLYYTTTQPNRFVEFDIVSKTVTGSLDLTKAPNCFSIDEENARAVIGHNGLISVIALNNRTNIKNITVDIPIYDIEWGANDWVCYTESNINNVQWTKMYWVNINTESKQASEQSVFQNCVVKKVPGQNYVIASETALSSGVYVYNTLERTQKSSMHRSMGNIWFLKNGEFVLTGEGGSIYRTSSILAASGYDDFSAIDKLKFGNLYYNRVIWADYCAAQGVWALYNESYSYNNFSDRLALFEDADYYPVKTFYHTTVYIKNGVEYEVGGRYAFANQAGTEVIVLSNATNNSAVWLMEFISVSK